MYDSRVSRILEAARRVFEAEADFAEVVGGPIPAPDAPNAAMYSPDNVIQRLGKL